MIVVADTSPLNYLILIGHIDVLEPLYGRIGIPAAVRDEMLRPQAPAQVRFWAANLPGWLAVYPPQPSRPLSSHLDLGEREAISLALTLNAPALIIDEIAGRKEAEACGLRVIGTLGILREADALDLLDLEKAIHRLRTTNFRISSEVLSKLQTKL